DLAADLTCECDRRIGVRRAFVEALEVQGDHGAGAADLEHYADRLGRVFGLRGSRAAWLRVMSHRASGIVRGTCRLECLELLLAELGHELGVSLPSRSDGHG